MRLTKAVVFFGRPVTLSCDGRCDKAWGHNGRTSLPHLSDDELGTAPGPLETYVLTEGSDAKPSAVPLTAADGERMNKWCARECERAAMASTSASTTVPAVEDIDRDGPESFWQRDGSIAVCRFCAFVREGTASATIAHFDRCVAVVTYYDVLAEDVPIAAALRLAARAHIRRHGSRTETMRDSVDALLAATAAPISKRPR